MPPLDIREYKSNLRANIKAGRMRLPPDEKLRLDRAVLHNLLRLREYKQCRQVLCYVSTSIEVDTKMFIGQALADGKQVAVPRCLVETRGMDFHYIRSLNDLSPGAFSVLEPSPDLPLAEVDPHTLLIVPALSIDQRGYRLGYGKGYYDRYMARYPGVAAGICYSENYVPRILHGRFDCSVGIIITEKCITTLSK